MSKPASSTDIAALAADILATDEVSDIEVPGTDAIAAVFNRWYDVVRSKALEAFPWSFASKRAAIALSASAPDFGYEDAYELPSDYVSLNFIDDETKPLSYWDYTIEGRRLLIDNDAEVTLNIGYVYDLTDVSIMPATFQIYLATEMAFAVVQKLCTGAIVGRVEKKVLPARLLAQAANGKSNPPKKYRQNSMITGRRLYQG